MPTPKKIVLTQRRRGAEFKDLFWENFPKMGFTVKSWPEFSPQADLPDFFTLSSAPSRPFDKLSTSSA
jgi:hypothetical protein